MDAFVETPLVCWVKPLLPDLRTESFSESLLNGSLQLELLQLFSKNPDDSINDLLGKKTWQTNLQRWRLLLTKIKAFYKDVLGQVLVAQMPNVVRICCAENPPLEEIEKSMVLLLGCAIQSDRNVDVISFIQNEMDQQEQMLIKQYITDVLSSPEYILKLDGDSLQTTSSVDDQPNEKTTDLHNVLAAILEQRDELDMALAKAELERQKLAERVASAPPLTPSETTAAGLDTTASLSSTSADGPSDGSAGSERRPELDAKHSHELQQLIQERNQLLTQLASSRSHIRHIEQELDERADELSELKDELEQRSEDLCALRKENGRLEESDVLLRTYVDEIDHLRDKAERVDRVEKENKRLHEHVADLQFAKQRTEALNETNSLLERKCDVLTQQLHEQNRAAQQLADTRDSLDRLEKEVADLRQQRDAQKACIQDLTLQCAKLAFEQRSATDSTASLQEELDSVRAQFHSALSGTSPTTAGAGSLQSEMYETASFRIVQLELDNQHLSKELEEARRHSLVDSSASERVAVLENENERLRQEAEDAARERAKERELDESARRQLAESRRRAETELADARAQLAAERAAAERAHVKLDKEKQQLQNALDALHSEASSTEQLQRAELDRQLVVLRSQMAELEYDNGHLSSKCSSLEKSVEELEQLRRNCLQLQNDNRSLELELGSAQKSSRRLETAEAERLRLELDNKRLQTSVDTLKEQVARLEHVEEECITAKHEIEVHQFVVETLRQTEEKLADTESNRDQLSSKVASLERQLGLKTSHSRELELRTVELQSKLQQAERQTSTLREQLEATQQERESLEAELSHVKSSSETLRLNVARLERADNERLELDAELERVRNERASLHRELDRTKSTLRKQTEGLDEAQQRVGELEFELKSAKRAADRVDSLTSRVAELERDNAELTERNSALSGQLADAQKRALEDQLVSDELAAAVDRLNAKIETALLSPDEPITEQFDSGEVSEAGTDEVVEDSSAGSGRLRSVNLIERRVWLIIRKLSQAKDAQLKNLANQLEESRHRHKSAEDDVRRLRQEMKQIKLERLKTSSTASTSTDSDTGSNATTVADALKRAKEDNGQLKEQLTTLRTCNDQLQSELAGLGDRLNTVTAQQELANEQTQRQQTKLRELLNNNAHLQLQLQSSQSDASAKARQLEQSMAAKQKLADQNRELEELRDSLHADYDALQRLNGQLANENERLVTEARTLKEQIKTLRQQVKEAGRISDKERQLIIEEERLKLNSSHLTSRNVETQRLHDEHAMMKESLEKMNEEYKQLYQQYTIKKQEQAELKRKLTSLREEHARCKERFSSMELEYAKMIAKFDSMQATNLRLEEEIRELADQHNSMLQLYEQLLHELFRETMDSHNRGRQSEKLYRERLSQLQRQKTMLEEKLIEQYKRWNPPKKRGIGHSLVKKARSLIKRKRAQNLASSTGDLLNVASETDTSSVASGVLLDAALTGDTHLSSETLGDGSGDSHTLPSLSRRHRRYRLGSSDATFKDSDAVAAAAVRAAVTSIPRIEGRQSPHGNDVTVASRGLGQQQDSGQRQRPMLGARCKSEVVLLDDDGDATSSGDEALSEIADTPVEPAVSGRLAAVATPKSAAPAIGHRRYRQNSPENLKQSALKAFKSEDDLLLTVDDEANLTPVSMYLTDSRTQILSVPSSSSSAVAKTAAAMVAARKADGRSLNGHNYNGQPTATNDDDGYCASSGSDEPRQHLANSVRPTSSTPLRSSQWPDRRPSAPDTRSPALVVRRSAANVLADRQLHGASIGQPESAFRPPPFGDVSSAQQQSTSSDQQRHRHRQTNVDLDSLSQPTSAASSNGRRIPSLGVGGLRRQATSEASGSAGNGSTSSTPLAAAYTQGSLSNRSSETGSTPPPMLPPRERDQRSHSTASFLSTETETASGAALQSRFQSQNTGVHIMHHNSPSRGPPAAPTQQELVGEVSQAPAPPPRTHRLINGRPMRFKEEFRSVSELGGYLDGPSAGNGTDGLAGFHHQPVDSGVLSPTASPASSTAAKANLWYEYGCV